MVEHSPELVAEALATPGGWVYVMELAKGADPRGSVSPSEIRGAWKVGISGEIEGDFVPNPNFVERTE